MVFKRYAVFYTRRTPARVRLSKERRRFWAGVRKTVKGRASYLMHDLFVYAGFGAGMPQQGCHGEIWIHGRILLSGDRPRLAPCHLPLHKGGFGAYKSYAFM